ncbi:MAG: hypothetical protein ACTHN8_11700 [Angustibacter sp.]
MSRSDLASLSSAAALMIAAAALLLGGLALASTRRLHPALGILLDLLLAAGLLRLAFLGTSKAIAGAAALVVIRKLAVYALSTAAVTPAARTPPRAR